MYINHRINTSADIRNNISMNGNMELQTQVKFCAHVQTLSRGCFLYCKLLLDLIEKGHLVLKSTNYKILPVNLSEIFLLLFNLKFPTIRSFEKLCVILNVCLASLYPLTLKVCLSTHSPSRYVPLSTHPQGVSLYPLILKVCLTTHSPSGYVPLPTHPQGMSLYPLTLKVCLSTHSPSGYVPLSTHPQVKSLHPLCLKVCLYAITLKVCFSTHLSSGYVPLPTHPQGISLYPLSLKVCLSTHSPSRYVSTNSPSLPTHP